MYTILEQTSNNEKVVILFHNSTDLTLALPYIYSLGVEVQEIVIDVGDPIYRPKEELGGLIYDKNFKRIELVATSYLESRKEFN